VYTWTEVATAARDRAERSTRVVAHTLLGPITDRCSRKETAPIPKGRRRPYAELEIEPTILLEEKGN